MKTLIINGSPKRNGDTAALVNALARGLSGEARTISRENGLSPCVDCRYCWKNPGCALDDGMDEVYDYLAECDNVVFASPIWFSSLSGPALDIASRFQTLFAAKFFRGETPYSKSKNGVLIITGGQKGTEIAPVAAALTIMKLLRVRVPLASEIYSLDTDNVPAESDASALRAASDAAELLNRLNGNPTAG